MHTKRVLLAVLCCCVFTGCSNSTSGSKSSDTTTESEADTTTETQKKSASKYRTSRSAQRGNSYETDDPGTLLKKSRYTTNDYLMKTEGNKLFIIFDGQVIGTITTDQEFTKDSKVSVEDYDSDDVFDIFIYDNDPVERLGDPGEYWVWNSDELQFQKSEPLNAVYGKGLAYDIGERSLVAHYSEYYTPDFARLCTVTLKWEDDRLVPVSLKKCYGENFIGQGQFEWNYTELYEPDDEYKMVLKERTLTSYDSNVPESTEKNPLYLRIAENSVEVMQGSASVQSIPLSGAAKLNASMLGVSDTEKYCPIEFDFLSAAFDYDLDGNKDLRLVTSVNALGKADKYTYYHFDPESGTYTEWKELNDIAQGRELITENDTVICQDDIYEECRISTSVTYYVWENGKLRADKRKDIIEFKDVNGSDFFKESHFYRYDAEENQHEYAPDDTPKVVS